MHDSGWKEDTSDVAEELNGRTTGARVVPQSASPIAVYLGVASWFVNMADDAQPEADHTPPEYVVTDTTDALRRTSSLAKLRDLDEAARSSETEFTGCRPKWKTPEFCRPISLQRSRLEVETSDLSAKKDVECDNAKIDLSDDDEEMEMSGEVPSGEPIIAASGKPSTTGVEKNSRRRIFEHSQ
eukprot:g29930.t1